MALLLIITITLLFFTVKSTMISFLHLYFSFLSFCYKILSPSHSILSHPIPEILYYRFPKLQYRSQLFSFLYLSLIFSSKSLLVHSKKFSTMPYLLTLIKIKFFSTFALNTYSKIQHFENYSYALITKNILIIQIKTNYIFNTYQNNTYQFSLSMAVLLFIPNLNTLNYIKTNPHNQNIYL